MKKLIALVLTVCMLFTVACGGTAPAEKEDVAILYTNDVHTYIDGVLSYDVIAAIKTELAAQYKNVLLVDAGDHSQGTVYGSMDFGETIIKLMNQSGYDLATLGNHEFDYSMVGTMDMIEWAQFPYVSANFYKLENGERTDNVLDSYKMFEIGGHKLAFVGITTPESFTKSTPAYFQNEDGEYIYGISGGDAGEDLQADVQKAIDEAKKAGATKVIALGHLGEDASSQPWTSRETIANVSGLDAFIDGHSHSTVEGDKVADKDGKEVLLTQTGEYFDRIGLMVITADGEIKTDFIEYEEILEKVKDENGNVKLDDDGNEIEEVVGYKLVSELYAGA
ncbi:MAG: bifunctional metallophosphatase/5'-nucleotidase, partial [Oscillospiraceae bacterium]|nr:bifunctional metallophosphatase/5'-nucleotidase [Oscillospiraceae bacterium]